MKTNPFAELEVNDDTEELRDMISRLGNADELCSAEDFISADNDIPVCSDTCSENWEADFLAQIGPKGKTEIAYFLDSKGASELGT